jgi:2C-methyl-D-erythritol 2,4-cyclodiphosphate synthase
MEGNIASALGISADMVTVKGKTNEGIDSIGRGEAMAAYALMLLEIPA